MAGVGRVTGGWLRQVRGLFGFGTLGGLSDGQLLDAFVSRRGDDSEAAFEALMHRHGPMVLRCCRRVLRDPQDAEDAFQATFLVLAHRAGAIRRRDSVASWLFGVSQRVAAQARLRAARRRAGEKRVAEHTPEAYRPAETPEEPEALIEEIDRLPERLRTAVVLCYLEGLTYDAAARRLGLSEGSIRGRLARARDQLRRRLTRRGMTLPAGLVAAGTVAERQARAAASVALPASLVSSTTRMALGVQAGEAAAILARGVLRSMVLGHLRSAALVLLAVLGSGLIAWQALAARDDEKARRPEPAGAASGPAASPDAERPTDGPYAITGRVSIEGTGEPVPGARLEAFLGSYSGNPIIDASRSFSLTVQTGADGRYRVALPAGYASIVLAGLPPGYYDADRRRWSSDVILSREDTVARKDYTVRRGHAWEFNLRGDDGAPLAAAKVSFLASNPAVLEEYFALSDPSGKAIVTLPLDGRKLVGSVGGPKVDVGPTHHELEWEPGFNPGAVRSVARDPGKPGRLYEAGWPQIARAIAQAPGKSSRFRITDESGNTAVIGAVVPIEPVVEHGRLVIRMTTSSDRAPRRGELTGLVLDPQGQLVAGARVVLAYIRDRGREGFLSRDKEHWVTTDSRGRYHIGSVRCGSDAGPEVVQLVATKPGFSRSESEAFVFKPGREGGPVEVAPIRLGRDVTLSGTVLDPQGRPVEGAWVQVSPTSIRNEDQFARTDRAGRFAFQGLSRGASRVNVRYGDLQTGMLWPADAPSREVVLQLRERPKPGAPPQAATAGPAGLRLLATGQPAPEWQVGRWSDGQARRLADYRGRIVFLDFWGIWCGPCLSSLPVLKKLKERFEPRGVVFLSIHTPGHDESAINRALVANQSKLVYAIDQTPGGQTDRDRGITADRYGIRGFPSVFLIDREGKIALRDGDPSLGPKVQALLKETGIDPDPKRFTEEQSQLLLEQLFAREIADLLKAPRRNAASP
jgi:RNA polymerase sigma factor (sigma-70 family)